MVNILGANSVSGGYEISNSIRWNHPDQPALTLSPSTSGNRRTFTISTWFKRSFITNNESCVLFNSNIDSSNNRFQLDFGTDDVISVYNRTGGTTYSLVTNAKFRDPSAWYHVVLIIDTTDGTAADRHRLYVNGTRITSFADNSTISQNAETAVNHTSSTHALGDKQWQQHHSDGYQAETHFIDGTAVEPSSFGETDDNGVWIPKAYTGSYGTNGFFMEFKQTGTGTNASGIGADTSGNDNHFAVTNLAATDVTTDTPTNNFCTLNPAGGINSSGKWTFSEGNTQIQQNNNGNWRATGSTMAVANGKWYWEIEFDAGTMSEIFVGVHDSDVSLEGTNRWVTGSTLFYNHAGGEVRQDGSNTTADYGVLTAGDILGVALNMDDKQISFYDNGSAIVSNFALSSSIIGFAMPTFMSDASNIVYKVNFGNPAFAISSGNADANGYGNFEYSPTIGGVNYYSLCTKNLAEFG